MVAEILSHFIEISATCILKLNNLSFCSAYFSNFPRSLYSSLGNWILTPASNLALLTRPILLACRPLFDAIEQSYSSVHLTVFELQLAAFDSLS